MWWILGGLLILIGWAIWFILDIALWIPVTVSAVIVVGLITLFVVRKIRARRAANALEKAIAQQGSQQAMNARPERRAEIQDLQKQITGGIDALKKSKLGGKSGSAALYTLPWYVIIGPPGAGKTTAIKHSGLVFPYAADSVRGVGGTRNCDWWFTNEAILLDTAGRYTTEHEDRDEWIAFLQMLKKYRSRRPINGILVAISISDLIDANEAQVESYGKQIRARIDEVMTQLSMVVPVYCLFTKIDLVAGFIEFFGDYKKSDRSQAWGATLKLAEPKTEPGKLFEREFDVLVKQAHGRSLKRLVLERNREARERVYQFPLELAGVKRNLSELISTVFAVNAFQGTPIFRGFYFTSGTQEGRPLDRVLNRMGAAMGIAPTEAQAAPTVESKSYFLHDVFMNVVFPDGDIAARSASEIRRQKAMRVAISGAALLLAGILAGPSIVSYLNNRELIDDTQKRAKLASEIDWADTGPATEKLEDIKPVLDRLLELNKWQDEGEPFGMGWMMYSGDTLYKPALAVYVSSLQRGFVVPVKKKLERRLKVAKGDDYLEERQTLKAYLMMSDVDNLDVDWATLKLTGHWTELVRPSTDVPEDELRHMLEGHVRYYLTLLKEGKVEPLKADKDLVEDVRATLQAVPVRRRYYDLFVNSVGEEVYRDEGGSSFKNRRFPPFSLKDIFIDRPSVREVLLSQKFQKDTRWQQVEGPYTIEGYARVSDLLKEGRVLLEREQWVVPLTDDEDIKKVPQHLKKVKDEYEENYINQWNEFLKDIEVKSPTSVKETVELYEQLIDPDWPYLRLIRWVEDNTQFGLNASSKVNKKGIGKEINTRINKKIRSKTKLDVDLDINKLNKVKSRIPGEYIKIVEFGVPLESGKGNLTETSLAKYVDILTKLRDDLREVEDATGGGADPRLVEEKLVDARKETKALLEPFQGRAKRLLEPLLLTPLYIGKPPELSEPGLGGAPPPKGWQAPKLPPNFKP